MSNNLVITVILFAFILFIFIFVLLRKGRIPVKYALIWFFAILIILITSIIPNLMEHLAKLLGFELLSNMVLCLLIAVLMIVTIVLTVMMAGQKKKTTLLIQELSILKSEYETEVKKHD